MEKKFWDKRWSHGKIGFHNLEFHPLLVHYFEVINQTDKNIFVPLCGKSLDFLYLKQKKIKTIGLEFVEEAIKAFIEENKENVLFHDPAIENDYKIYQGMDLYDPTIYQIDFYKLPLIFDKLLAFDLDLIYDRAALVSQPPHLWQKYAEIYIKLAKFLMEKKNKKLKILLNSFIHPEENERQSGPPFTILRDDILKLFEKDFDIQNIMDKETAYLLTYQSDC